MSRRAEGLRAWLLQRASAVYLALFSLYFLATLLQRAPWTFEPWRAWLAQPAMIVGIGLFFGALLIHAWVGMRDVIMDYVRVLWARVLALALLGLVLSGMGVWVARVLVRLAVLP